MQALDCGDGRHVLLTEPQPRYIPSLQLLEAYELVEERRTTERRTKTAKRVKGEKRKAARRAPATPATNGNGDGRKKKEITGARAEAHRLWDEGLDPPEIAKKVKENVGNIYYWKKADKWEERKKQAAPAVKEQAAQIRCRHCGQMTPANGKWCVHCMQDP